MNLGKISFFKRIYLAITDFRMYPYAQKESTATAIGYFLKLLIFTAIILGVFITSAIFKEIPTILELYNDSIPDFEIINGVFVSEDKVEKEINDEYYLIANSNFKYHELKNLNISNEEAYNYYVFLLSDATVFCARVEDKIYEIGSLNYDSNMNFNKQQLADSIQTLGTSVSFKLIIWIGTSVGVFILLCLVRLWTLVMYMISAYIINFMFALRLRLSEYIKLVIYISTLPVILEVIAILLVGRISETINFLTILISCVYIFYALRAIKLDSLILGGSGKNAEERIKNALANAQEELKKQLDEIEKKDEVEKKSEKKEIEELSKELREKEENLLKAQKEYQEAIKKAMDVRNDTKDKDSEAEENK